MATYVYETIPQQPSDPVLQFEFQQSMKDAPLTRHPDTNVPVRRVITGGFGLIGANTGRSGHDAKPKESSAPAHQHGGAGCCGGACGCSH